MPTYKNEAQKQYAYMEEMKGWVKTQEERLGRPLTCHITTFGCQMNEKDSEKLLGVLETIGYQETDTEYADLVLFNTCTVRENANTKLYGHLGHVKKAKEKNPDMMIGLCGCMMQEEQVVEKIGKSYPFVDLIFGTHNIFKLAELLKARVESGGMIVDIWKDTDQIVEDLPSDRKFSFKCGVNIMFGCNNFCSYCIVPYVRGRERSRKPEDIVREIEGLVKEGVREVMLLGQNVNSYGKNLDKPVSFAELLTMIEQIEGLSRIRFMTPHPKDLSDDLIDVMASSKKVCRHMHLPVQSGSSRILKLMNRHYTKEDYLALAEKIKEKIPGIAMTTDIIVGFPGETEEDFEETLDVVRKVKFDSAYTFVYSKRTGTPAAAMEEQVEPFVVKKRFQRLLEVIKESSKDNRKDGVGKVEEVLVEEKNTHQDGMVTGRLSNNILVHFKGGDSLIGQIVRVKITEEKGFYYMGEQVNG
ncbi:tRNA (N6-isopentenyl adenosine(37)-C2)-methylthiotransferase MiaB [Anaerostipes sp.]|uniref:tRNA (N6-isopentenyl adenosine(37)-C2)-methylthiotransferase MiaB n=1 Tax=Anaerostipes sp. TaxID=1872530 RepID=UPI0025BE190B|nr:tRNA (N6-isopentenyl adenosine(37)-C2)-methylthiotransferase MiaB [Anaerostipes sp.]MBS7008200.1 tRNA (N6-isopentenyl adenosine(37)-C2)-methylthiotransferase MiaB [Anaerostipes sp.]